MRKILQELAVKFLAFSGLPYLLSYDDGRKLLVVTRHRDISEADKSLLAVIIIRFTSELKKDASASNMNTSSILDEPIVEESALSK